jgi:predicted dehydrogenase
VLRYAPAFVKAGQLIQEGTIGKLIAINALEAVTFSHQSHSYVRGNWRKAAETTPMILAKCCHDLDLLQYYAHSKCKSISSVGDLTFFNKENAPKYATARCLDCPHQDTCPYSAKTLYLKWWKDYEQPEDRWPFNVIAPAPLTEEKLLNAIQNGPYGRCVFACDNDVVDHQLTQITFENGVKANLTMMAFVGAGGRRMNFYGTHGDLQFDESTGKMIITRYGIGVEEIPLSDLTEKGFGHGGGDHGIINSLYKILTGEIEAESSLEASIESHLMGICAEESRKNGGKLITLR